MANVVRLGDPRQQLDVRMNMGYPPVLGTGFVDARMVPIFSGCGSPGAPCRGDEPLPASVEAMRNAVRGASLGGLLDAYLGEVSEPTRTTYVQSPIFRLLSMVGIGASAYHGYKRSGGSIGWTLGWALLGIIPVITIPVAIAQGFGKRKQS